MSIADASPLPRVTVLLATFNGLRWLPEQLASILNQNGVDLRVVALDDESTDGTREWLVEQAALDSRLMVLPSQGSSGSSAANFYRLIDWAAGLDKLDQRDALDQRNSPDQRNKLDQRDELFAFADQDDVWRPGKLARHAHLLSEERLAGVSSSVTSFTASGERTLVRKDYPQRRLDYVFESPGPGSTFLITSDLLKLVADRLAVSEWARQVDFHDSLIYAIARGSGGRWLIDGEPSVDYRQHDDNVMGSNVGLRSAFARFTLIREHWLRNHATLLARAALEVATDETRSAITNILTLLTTSGPRARFALAKQSKELRRRPRDQRIVGLLIAAGVW